MARLDRLGPAAKEVAQIGAAIGREFSYELAASVGEHAEERLQDALQRLVDAGLVFQRGTPPEAVYLFKHALVQDTAYSTLLRGPRRQLHARIAEALEAHYRELMDSQPERFAQHYADAGLIEKSAAYCGKVGHGSAARSAMAEAAAQFRKGLDQLALLADEPDRQRQELEYCSALGAVLILVKGCRRTGDGSCLCPSARAVGAAGISRTVPSSSLRAVAVSLEPWRTRSGATLGRGSDKSEPPSQGPQRDSF